MLIKNEYILINLDLCQYKLISLILSVKNTNFQILNKKNEYDAIIKIENKNSDEDTNVLPYRVVR